MIIYDGWWMNNIHILGIRFLCLRFMSMWWGFAVVDMHIAEDPPWPNRNWFRKWIWIHATPSHRRKPMHPSLSIHQSHAESGDLWTGVKEQPAQPTGTQGLSMVLWTPKNQTELKASTGFWTILSHYEALWLWSIMNPTYHQYLTPKLTASCGVATPSGRKALKSWAEGRVGYPNQSEVPMANHNF